MCKFICSECEELLSSDWCPWCRSDCHVDEFYEESEDESTTIDYDKIHEFNRGDY